MQLNHTHTKDIEARIKQLSTDFRILTKANAADNVRLLALDEMEQAAQEIVTSIQSIKREVVQE